MGDKSDLTWFFCLQKVFTVHFEKKECSTKSAPDIRRHGAGTWVNIYWGDWTKAKTMIAFRLNSLKLQPWGQKRAASEDFSKDSWDQKQKL